VTKVQVKAVLFDLFDTLLLVEGGEVWYKPALRKLHKFLVSNGVRVAFEGFSRVYFEVRDELYAESEKNLEEPHFNVRVSETLKRLGYDFDASDPLVAGATKVFADEFAGYKLRAHFLPQWYTQVLRIFCTSFPRHLRFLSPVWILHILA